MRNLLIVGHGEFANIAYEYFTHDSDYSVIGFAVNQAYLDKNDSFLGLPLVPLEMLPELFDLTKMEVFVAIPATKMNNDRARVFFELKALGIRFASYVSSRAFVWQNVKIGENSFIFENNVLQPFVEIGNNVIMWSGNHIGHRTRIDDNVFLSSHCVVSGYCSVGKNSFLGVNCTIIDKVSLAPYTLVGAGALMSKDSMENSIYIGSPARAVPGKRATDSDI
jgi:sugar O-acyltransferase (sialic acid O-acetyltransferase NeuD family)